MAEPGVFFYCIECDEVKVKTGREVFRNGTFTCAECNAQDTQTKQEEPCQ